MRFILLFIIVLTAFVSCGEDKGNTNETDKCKDVTCDEWQSCNTLNGNCETKESRCSNNGECSGSQICDINHNCVNPIDPCEGQSCSNFGVCAIINNTAKCFCNNGYTADGLTCVDINECEENTDNCQAGFTCENIAGGFVCNEIIIDLCASVTCDEWEQCNSINGQCETKESRCLNNGECSGSQICDENHNCVNPIDPCEGQSCSNFGVCAIINNTAKCFCNTGYTEDGLSCIDIDECFENTDNCQAGYTCENTAGGFICNEIIVDLCASVTCDEWEQCNSTNGNCETKENRCSNNGECSGSQICDENHNCVNPIDPCEGQSCSNFGECAIINNTAKCFCNNGYKAEGLTCVEIDECEENTDNCQAGFTCENIAGGFVCNDINECDLNFNNCLTGFTCENTAGGFLCNEINECENNTHNCEAGYDCENTAGSFVCNEINECENNTHNCEAGYECENTTGSFICNDIDECALNIDTCDAKAICTNTPGSYNCECRNGFNGDGFICDYNPFTVSISIRESLTGTIGINNNYSYNYHIDCNNDGIFEAFNVTSSYTCNYETVGNYQIAITGDFPAMLKDTSSIACTVNNWGSIKWKTMSRMFFGCNRVDFVATDTPDLSEVTDMSEMFRNVIEINSVYFGITYENTMPYWDVSNVTNMQSMFTGVRFNQDLSNWNVSNVTNMQYMFNNTISFNKDLSGWDVDQVASCRYVYTGATAWTLPKPNFTSCTP